MSQKHPDRDRNRAAKIRRELVQAQKKAKKEARVELRQKREAK
jgi:hypothetical protein